MVHRTSITLVDGWWWARLELEYQTTIECKFRTYHDATAYVTTTYERMKS